jgi:hypothetical protein
MRLIALAVVALLLQSALAALYKNGWIDFVRIGASSEDVRLEGTFDIRAR